MDDICYLTARELADSLRSRALSAREVVEAHLRRVEQVNPTINAVVTLVGDRAMTEAAAADERLARGEPVGPLHGLPVAHKDTHDTAGIRTTYGSPILAKNVPARDAPIVARMRAAGAITIGKANVPEFGAGSHTVNTLFGATANPYRPTHSAGGSSGGTAAALAAGMHPLGDGSDMGGSLRNPASFCNVVGLRPSPGRVPSWPDPLPWATLSVPGPMARTVSDTALLLSVIAGPDPRSPLSIDQPGAAFAAPLPLDLTGLRVAWSPDLGGLPVDPAVTAVLEPALRVFQDLGCTVDQATPDLTHADEVFRVLRAWQFEVSLGTALSLRRDQMKATLVDNIEQGRRLTGPDIGRAQQRQGALFQNMADFFEHHDVLLAPVSQVPPFPITEEYPTEIAGHPMRDYIDWMSSAAHISATGCPALSVPAGFTPDGLPIGLQVIAPHRREDLALRVGHAFEQATAHTTRRPNLPAHPTNT